jgi:DNA-binding transcriptional MerR regulator
VSDVTEGALNASHQLTIDELARQAGMTVRNIRAHQSRGLLPPPEVRGRTGYYGREHLARLELIKEMQAEGFNLEAIRRLLPQAGGSSEEVLRFTRTVREPFEEEESEIVDVMELGRRWGALDDPDLGALERAQALGLIRHLGDGTFEELSPRLARAGRELVDLGIPMDRGLDVVEVVRAHAQGVAECFVELFLEEILKPFVEAGRPESRWPEVQAALERLRPLASDALMAVFGLVMTETTEEAMGKEIGRLGDEAPAAPL